jgi:hypothetical protein
MQEITHDELSLVSGGATVTTSTSGTLPPGFTMTPIPGGASFSFSKTGTNVSASLHVSSVNGVVTFSA